MFLNIDKTQFWNHFISIERCRDEKVFSPLALSHSKMHGGGCSKFDRFIFITTSKSHCFSRGFFSPLDTAIWELFFFQNGHICIGHICYLQFQFARFPGTHIVFYCLDADGKWHLARSQKDFTCGPSFLAACIPFMWKRGWCSIIFFPVWQCSIDCSKIAALVITAHISLNHFHHCFWLFGGTVWKPSYL